MKVGRYLLLILIGGVIGGFIGMSIGVINTNNLLRITHFSNVKTVLIIVGLATIINIILTLYLYIIQNNALKYKKKVTEDIEDDLVDYYEKSANLNFNKAHIIYYVELIISFISLFFIVLGNGNDKVLLYALIPYLFTIIPSLMIGFFVQKFDPRYPKLGEKNYTEKVLNLYDEGEKHIILQSMYKAFCINIYLLMTGIIILGFFSLATNENQTIGVFILIILFIYNIYTYFSKLIRFYKHS